MSPDAVRGAFAGAVRPVRASVGYRLAALFAAVLLVVLPVVYLAVIAAAGWGVWWHFTQNDWMLSAGRGRGRVLMWMLYVAPGPVGAAVILSLLKPLVARDAGREQARPLRPEDQPTLFALIEGVCDAVHAPRPDRVHADTQVNMSASTRGGLFGLVGGDLVLTVGVPLAAGLTANSFAGVLAHEFGHFAQRGGRGVTRFTGAVHHWFVHAVHGRDRWDELLVELSEETDVRLGWVFWLCRAAVGTSRLVLGILLQVSAAATYLLARQQEHDADRYQARLVGGDVVADTVRRVTALSVGWGEVTSDLGDRLRDGTLPDDLPAATIHAAPPLSVEDAVTLERRMRGGRAGLFDSHPMMADRVARAARETGEPAFALDRPAADLFADLPELCHHVTLDLYYAVLGRRPDRGDLSPVRPLPDHPAGRPTASTNTASTNAAGSAGTAAGATPAATDAPPAHPRPLPYGRPAVAAPHDLRAHLARLTELAARVEQTAARREKAVARYRNARVKRGEAALARAGAGLTRIGSTGVPGEAYQQAAGKLERIEAKLAERGAVLSALEEPLAEHRLLALDLYADPKVAAKLKDAAAARREADALLAFSTVLAAAKADLDAVRDAAAALAAPLAAGGVAVPGLSVEVKTRAATLVDRMSILRDTLAAAPDPFALGSDAGRGDDGFATVANRFPPTTGKDPALLARAAIRLLEDLDAAAAHADRRLADLAARVTGRVRLGSKRG